MYLDPLPPNHKENIDGLKTKKFDPHLPIASSKMLKRYLGYKYLLDVEKEAIVKVMLLLFTLRYTVKKIGHGLEHVKTSLSFFGLCLNFHSNF